MANFQLPELQPISEVPPTQEFAKALCDRVKKQIIKKRREEKVSLQRSIIRNRIEGKLEGEKKYVVSTQTVSCQTTISFSPQTNYSIEKIEELRPELRVKKVDKFKEWSNEVNENINKTTTTNQIFQDFTPSKDGGMINSTQPTEIFWEVRFVQEEYEYDSEIFVFSGQRWRLNLCRNDNGRFSLLLSPVNHRDESIVNCEFRIHCVLKPMLSHKSNLPLYFSTQDASAKGLTSFITQGELISYLDSNGMLTFSVVLSEVEGSNSVNPAKATLSPLLSTKSPGRMSIKSMNFVLPDHGFRSQFESQSRQIPDAVFEDLPWSMQEELAKREIMPNMSPQLQQQGFTKWSSW